MIDVDSPIPFVVTGTLETPIQQTPLKGPPHRRGIVQLVSRKLGIDSERVRIRLKRTPGRLRVQISIQGEVNAPRDITNEIGLLVKRRYESDRRATSVSLVYNCETRESIFSYRPARKDACPKCHGNAKKMESRLKNGDRITRLLCTNNLCRFESLQLVSQPAPRRAPQELQERREDTPWCASFTDVRMVKNALRDPPTATYRHWWSRDVPLPHHRDIEELMSRAGKQWVSPQDDGEDVHVDAVWFHRTSGASFRVVETRSWNGRLCAVLLNDGEETRTVPVGTFRRHYTADVRIQGQ